MLMLFSFLGKPLKLSLATEEIATFYAKMLDHEYTTKEIFQNNFFNDWRKVPCILWFPCCQSSALRASVKTVILGLLCGKEGMLLGDVSSYFLIYLGMGRGLLSTASLSSSR